MVRMVTPGINFPPLPAWTPFPVPAFLRQDATHQPPKNQKIPGTNIRAALFSSLNGLPTRSFFRTPPRKFQIKTSDQKKYAASSGGRFQPDEAERPETAPREFRERPHAPKFFFLQRRRRRLRAGGKMKPL